jgi:hypothetical protein
LQYVCGYKTFKNQVLASIVLCAALSGCGGGHISMPSDGNALTGGPIVPASLAPVVSLPGSPLVYLAGDSAVLLDASATVADADSLDFDGGVLSVRIASGSDSDDRLDIRSSGTGAGQISVSGSDVLYEGAVIGTYSGEAAGSASLDVALGAGANPTSVQALLRAITYRNADATDPTNAARAVTASLSDGDGGESAIVSRDVQVHDPLPSLVAHYQFDEAPNAASALDSSTFGNHASLFNLAAIDWLQDGVIGQGLRTAATSAQYLSTPVNLAAADAFSFSLWIKPSASASSAPQIILWQGASGQNGWGSGLTPSASAHEMHLSLNYFNGCTTGLNFYLGSTDPLDPTTCVDRSPALVTDAMPSTSEWTHVAVSVTGANTALATVELYVGGVLRSTQTSDELDRSQWLSNLRIAAPSAAARQYTGDLDHVRIYTKALDAAEAALLAQEGR